MTDKKQIIYEVKHLQKSFGNVEVLKDINMKIENGEVCRTVRIREKYASSLPEFT